jgi:hypothetical protein
MVISAIVIGYAGCVLRCRDNNNNNENLAVLTEFRRSRLYWSRMKAGSHCRCAVVAAAFKSGRTQFQGTSPQNSVDIAHRIVHICFPRFWSLAEGFRVDWHSGNKMQLHSWSVCFELPAILTCYDVAFFNLFRRYSVYRYHLLPSTYLLPR